MIGSWEIRNGIDPSGRDEKRIDELPLLTKEFSAPLDIGMTFAFEPKFVFPGIGVVGLEDDYVVGEQGVERLTHAEDDIMTLRKS